MGGCGVLVNGEAGGADDESASAANSTGNVGTS